ncbi:MAG: hypothetical protein D3925_01270 [Candidatus Electrothrix sp. AR5]|nr:hypothetical protein [Candidatus Electrothrix sp. AR5]
MLCCPPIAVMYRKSHLLYISRLSRRGKQLFAYMMKDTGIPGAFCQEATEGNLWWALFPAGSQRKTNYLPGNVRGNKKRDLPFSW